MRCEHVKELLSAYLDNQLATEERQHVKTHLATCAECATILADFHHFDLLLARLPQVQPDPRIREKIFSSAAYRELTGTTGGIVASSHRATVPISRARRPATDRPHLVLLPGGLLQRTRAESEQDETCSTRELAPDYLTKQPKYECDEG